MILAAIEAPETGATLSEQIAILAGIAAGVAGFLMAAWAMGQVLSLRNRVDVMDDQATPSFRERFAERTPLTAPRPVGEPEPVRPTPYRRTDTVENEMPVAVETVKLEAEREPAYREFTLSDGSVRRFEIKDEQ